MAPCLKRTSRGNRWAPLRIAAVYVVASVLWLNFSDQLLSGVVQDIPRLTRLQTLKGVFFVMMTAGLLYFLIRRAMNALLESETARRRAEEQLLEQERTARIAAQEDVRRRDEFLMIAAHELRTPMTPVSVYVQLVRRQLRMVPDSIVSNRNALLGALDKADQQLARLAARLEEMIDVARICSGRLELHRTDVDFRQAVEERVECWQEKARAAGSDLRFSSDTSVRGNWDAGRFRHVVDCLVANAIKYGAGKPVEVRLWQEGEQAYLRVRDEGMGIAPEEQARVFERFGRAAPVEHFDGFGLGLFVSKGIVKAHGGTLTLESAVGQGSVFTVRL